MFCYMRVFCVYGYSGVCSRGCGERRYSQFAAGFQNQVPKNIVKQIYQQ